jgi:hypothetical protein
MWPQIHRFPIPIRSYTEKYVVEGSGPSAGHVDIDRPIRHFKILQSGDVIVEIETAPAEVVGNRRLGPKLPSGRIDGKRFSFCRAKFGEADDHPD